MELHRLDREDLLRVARGRVLTTGELARLLGVPRRNAAKAAFDLRRRGLLTLVRRGVYASVPLDADPRGFRPDPFLAVHKALGDRYAFSHFSAVALLGGEQQVREVLHVAAPGARPRRRALRDRTVHVHSLSVGSWETATQTVRRGAEVLRVTTPARTLIDLASLPGPEQDYEEELEAFRSLLPRVEPKEVLGVLPSMVAVAARARLGHLLGRVAADASKFQPVLAALEHSVTRASPTYLGTRPKLADNRFDPRFKVVYPGGI